MKKRSIAILLLLLSFEANAQVVKCVPTTKEWGFDQFLGYSHWTYYYDCTDGLQRRLEDRVDQPSYAKNHYSCPKMKNLFSSKPNCADVIKNKEKQNDRYKNTRATEDFASIFVRQFQKCDDLFTPKALQYLINGGGEPTWGNLGITPQTYSIHDVSTLVINAQDMTGGRTDSTKGCENCVSCVEPKKGYGFSVVLNKDLAGSKCKKGTTITVNVEKDSLMPCEVYPSKESNECSKEIHYNLSSRGFGCHGHESVAQANFSNALRKGKTQAGSEREKNAVETAINTYARKQGVKYSFGYVCNSSNFYDACGSRAFESTYAARLFPKKKNGEMRSESILAYPSKEFFNTANSFIDLSRNRHSLKLEFTIVMDWNEYEKWNTKGYWDESWEDKWDTDQSYQIHRNKLRITASFGCPEGRRSSLVAIDDFVVEKNASLHPLVKRISIPLSSFQYGQDFDWSMITGVEIQIDGDITESLGYKLSKKYKITDIEIVDDGGTTESSSDKACKAAVAKAKNTYNRCVTLPKGSSERVLCTKKYNEEKEDARKACIIRVNN